MLWFYTRGESRARLLTWLDERTQEFVAEIEWPGQALESHRFVDQEAFRSFLLGVERQLEADRFVADGAPRILPRDWRTDVEMN